MRGEKQGKAPEQLELLHFPIHACAVRDYRVLSHTF